MASKEQITTILVLLVTLSFQSGVNAQLRPNFYDRTCFGISNFVQATVQAIAIRDPQVPPSLLHLLYLDCFVNGCDASILLKDTPGFWREQNATQVRNTLRGLDAIDEIKAAVERRCPGVVSCADTLVLAARAATGFLPGLNTNAIYMRLGRRDTRAAGRFLAERSLPFNNASLSELISSFKGVGLNETDLVLLSGAHTFGRASCMNFRDRIYNETDIDPDFAALRQRTCPRTSGSGDLNLAPLDVNTSNSFDFYYFRNLRNKKGLLHTDQQLYSGGSTDSLVMFYSRRRYQFRNDFVKSLIKMSEIKPLTGRLGEIRRNCGRVN